MCTMSYKWEGSLLSLSLSLSTGATEIITLLLLSLRKGKLRCAGGLCVASVKSRQGSEPQYLITQSEQNSLHTSVSVR